MKIDSKIGRNLKYQIAMYPRRQVRDCIEGTPIIKSSNTLYLPMPSSWLNADVPPVSHVTNNGTVNLANRIPPDFVPWNHPNPMYRAYLQRARFPDITASALRGFLGIALKASPKIELPAAISYLEDEVASGGLSLEDFFAYCLTEVLSSGNINIAVDIDSDTGEFYMTTYSAESCPDWKLKRKNGVERLVEIDFIEDDDQDGADFSELTTRSYFFDEEGAVSVKICEKEESEDKEEIVQLAYRGKKFTRIPVFCAGSVENTPKPQIIPLMGISDVAIAIYQETADLRQSHFMTCSPTLFVFGLSQKEAPQVIGSNVIVAINNPNGKAEYVMTDTTAMQHIQTYIGDMFKEASAYGANFISAGSKESGEALGLRKAGQGASLVKAVRNVGRAINDALNFICEMKGAKVDEPMFRPNVEFAESNFTYQDLSAMVTAWMNGAFDHDTLLDGIRDGGFIKNEKSNDEIRSAIETQTPSIEPTLRLGNDKKDGEVEDENDEEEDGGEENKDKKDAAKTKPNEEVEE